MAWWLCRCAAKIKARHDSLPLETGVFKHLWLQWTGVGRARWNKPAASPLVPSAPTTQLWLPFANLWRREREREEHGRTMTTKLEQPMRGRSSGVNAGRSTPAATSVATTHIPVRSPDVVFVHKDPVCTSQHRHQLHSTQWNVDSNTGNGISVQWRW